jgi:thiaminase
MTYIDALSIYQSIAVNLQYAESLGKTREAIFNEWLDEFGFEKIMEAVDRLCQELDEKKEHYYSLLKIAGLVNKHRGGK